MGKELQLIFDWSEVWTLLIPLFVLIVNTKQPAFLKPVIIYLLLALPINLIGDIIADYKKYFPSWLQSNTPLYNIHSIVRFTCFCYFFISLKQPYFLQLKKILPLVSFLFIIINFGFFENFFNVDSLSGNLLSAEAYLLLVYCMLYYLAQLRDETDKISGGPDFWIVTGLSIYVVINFFVFLFYVPMIKENPELANNMWSVHNVAYITFSVFIAKAFYATNSN
ncbi:MAG TPA: hypothetical protein VH396_14415 [Chitinophagaceae bacterium]